MNNDVLIYLCVYVYMYVCMYVCVCMSMHMKCCCCFCHTENLILQKLGLEHLLTTSESSSQRAPAQGGNNEDGSYSDAERQYEIMDDVEETREQSYEDFSDFG